MRKIRKRNSQVEFALCWVTSFSKGLYSATNVNISFNSSFLFHIKQADVKSKDWRSCLWFNKNIISVCKTRYTPASFPWQVLLTMFMCSCVWTTNFLCRVLPWQVLFVASKTITQRTTKKKTHAATHGAPLQWVITRTRPLCPRNFSIFLTSFPCRAVQTSKFCNVSIFFLTSALVKEKKFTCSSLHTNK